MRINEENKYTMLLVLVAVVWGLGFIATDTALEHGYVPLLFQIVRFGVATLLLFAIAHRRIIANSRDNYKQGLLIGVVLFLAFTMQTVGLVYTSVSNSAFITSSYVVMVPFMLKFLDKNKVISKMTITGSFGTFAGLAIITLENGLSELNIGDLLTTICAILYAVHVVSIEYSVRKTRNYDLYSSVFYQFLATTILSVISFLLLNDVSDVKNVTTTGTIATLYAAIFATLFGFFVQNLAQGKVCSSKVSIIISTESVFAVIVSVIFFSEVLSINHILGFTIIFVSIILTQLDE